MTKLVVQVRAEPDGTPVANQTVRIRREADGQTLAVTTTDSEGRVSYQVDGHPGPIVMAITGIPGGDKYWTDYDAGGAGPLSLPEIPVALRVLGDGVIRGYLNGLVPAASGNNSLALSSGGVLVGGVPVINYSADTFTPTRPVTSTRIDLLIARHYPVTSSTTPGKAEFALLAGTEGGSAPSLTQTDQLYEVALATVTVPTVAPITVSDSRSFAGEKLPVTGVSRVSSFTTTDTSGVLITGSTVTLDIPRPHATYAVIAELTAQQLESQSVTSWVLQDTYGPTFNSLAISDPRQVGTDSTGRILIVDNDNSRLVILTSAGAYSTGITGLTNIKGVCRDSSDNIYVAYGLGPNVSKYSSALALQWTSAAFGSSLSEIATDGTHIYVIDTTGRKIWKRLCSTGAAVTSWGSLGSGDGQMISPYGVDYNPIDDLLYVVDTGNSRVQVFNTTGTYQRQWPISADARGIAIDASGDVLVAEYGQDAVKRYTNVGVLIDAFAQTDPQGIGVASGDVLFVSNAGDGTLAKWDESSTPGGYGLVAIEIDGVVGTYTGIGDRDGSVANADSGSKAGGSTVVVRAFAKATSATLTLKGVALSARAVPQR